MKGEVLFLLKDSETGVVAAACSALPRLTDKQDAVAIDGLLELVEHKVTSVEELRAGLDALRPREADAFVLVSDGMVISQTDLVVKVTNAKRLPAILSYSAAVTKGALASYGESNYTLGRFSAKHVQRVLLGADPGNLPVEQLNRPQFVVSLKAAKALGLTIPPSVLLRADQVIE